MSEIALPIAGVPPGLPLSGRFSSDERLARLASGGSERAVALLYERHHQALYRYCRSILRDSDDAQDALQSTMTRAYVALRSRERDLAVRPWLFRIAHNEAISILRTRRPSDPLVEEHESSDLSVEHTVDQRERLQLLVADLKALPVRQRAALVMRELSGLSIEEIAAALTLSPAVAKQTVFEARSSLHELAEGRAMECEAVRRAISDGDRRVLRARRIGAHLRGCAGCRDFRAQIDTRGADLRALAPPLPAAAAAMLARVIARGAGGGHAGGAATAGGAAFGSHAAGSLVVKGLVGAAVLAAASAGAIHLARDPAKHRHKHTSAVVSPVVPVRADTGVGRTGALHIDARSAPVAAPPGRHSIPTQAAPHVHASSQHGASGATAARSETGRTLQTSPSPAVGEGGSHPHHLHGGTPGGIGGVGQGSRKGLTPPPGPKRSRSHRPSKSLAPSTSPHNGQSRGEQKSTGPPSDGGNSHTSPHRAPAAQQPAGDGGKAAHPPTAAPGRPPPAHHGQSSK